MGNFRPAKCESGPSNEGAADNTRANPHVKRVVWVYAYLVRLAVLLLFLFVSLSCGSKQKGPKGPPPEYEEPTEADAGR